MSTQLIPDRPVAFGYKQQWVAVRARQAQEVAIVLGLKDVRPSTWQEGIERSYERSPSLEWLEVFVSPPISGWTLAVGGLTALPHADRPDWLPWLGDLSERLDHVHYFGTLRIVDYVAWAMAERGQVVRAYGYVDGRTLVDVGGQTPEEAALGFDLLDERRATPAEVEEHRGKVEAEWARMDAIRTEIESLRAEAETRGEELDETIFDDARFDSRTALLVPREDSVMLLAGRWSIDPTRLEEFAAEPGLGLLGSIQRPPR
jgi:hypothetical protein